MSDGAKALPERALYIPCPLLVNDSDAQDVQTLFRQCSGFVEAYNVKFPPNVDAIIKSVALFRKGEEMAVPLRADAKDLRFLQSRKSKVRSNRESGRQRRRHYDCDKI